MPRPIALLLLPLLALVAAEARGQAGGIGGPGGGISGMGGMSGMGGGFSGPGGGFSGPGGGFSGPGKEIGGPGKEIGGMGGQKSPHEAPRRITSVRVQPRGEVSVAFSRDGSRLALGGVGSIMIYDASDGHALGVIDRILDERVDRLAFSPDARWLASSSVGGSVELAGFGKAIRQEGGLACVWDVGTGQLLASTGLAVDPDALGFAPDGTLIVSTSGTRYKLDPPPGVGRPSKLVEVGQARPFGNARGQLADPSSVDRQGLRSARGGRPTLLRTFGESPDLDLSAAERSSSSISGFSADGKTLALVGSDHSITTWDVGARKVDRQTPAVRFPEAIKPLPSAIAFDPGAKAIVVGDSSGFVRIWDDRNPQPARTVVGPRLPVRAIAAVEGNRLRVASGGWYPLSPSNQGTTPVTLWEIDPAPRP